MCAPASDFSDYLAARAAFRYPLIAGAADWPWDGQRIQLDPVDEADVLVVVDNSVDMLAAGSERVRRPAPRWDTFEHPPMRAEHGLSLMLTVRRGGRESQILYDAGVGRDTALHNMDVLEIRPNQLRAMVLSHGHADHHGGMEGLANRFGRGLPLVLHPDAWQDRKMVLPTGAEVHLPPPSRGDLDAEGVQLVEERGPTLLIDNCVLVTGQVERTTGYEPGFPPQHAHSDGGWQPDPMVWDDQAVVVNVKDKGLLVLSGCGHAGMVNILRYARKLTGVEKVHGFVGGMHLTGALFEKIIPPTIEELTSMAIGTVVPCHCSGWKAQQELARRLPDAYVQSSVGSTIRF